MASRVMVAQGADPFPNFSWENNTTEAMLQYSEKWSCILVVPWSKFSTDDLCQSGDSTYSKGVTKGIKFWYGGGGGVF